MLTLPTYLRARWLKKDTRIFPDNTSVPHCSCIVFSRGFRKTINIQKSDSPTQRGVGLVCVLWLELCIYMFVTSVPASSSRSHEVLYHDSPWSLFSALSQCFGPPFFPTACAGVGQTIGLCTGGCMSLPPGERESSWQHQPHLWNDRGFLSTHLGNNAAGLLQSALPCKYPYPGYGRTEQLSSPRACAKHGVPIVRKEWW